jgi:uncharacterized protein YbcV (DUF1398 family)
MIKINETEVEVKIAKSYYEMSEMHWALRDGSYWLTIVADRIFTDENDVFIKSIKESKVLKLTGNETFEIVDTDTGLPCGDGTFNCWLKANMSMFKYVLNYQEPVAQIDPFVGG